MGERMSEGGEASGEQGVSGEQEGTPAGNHIDRELQAILEGTAGDARFREPTADDRGKLAKQAKKRREADAKKLAKLHSETQKQAQKLQKKALKEQRGSRRRARWRRALRRTAWTLSACALIAACVFAYTRYGHSLSGQGGPDDTQTVTNGAVPTGGTATTPSVSPLTESGPPADPFQGTPAETWDDGAAGITIPAAVPHGEFSAAQVESAYQATKSLLVAATLDRQTLLGGAPTAFANLLTPDQRDQFVSQLDKIGLDKDQWPVSSRSWIVQFAPGTTKFIGSDIKVHGTMSAGATQDNGHPVLRVKVDYITVYPVEPPRAPADWMRVVAQFNGSVSFSDWAGADTSFAPWWQMNVGIDGSRCGMKDGFIHPDYPSGPQPSVQPTGSVVDPYSMGLQPDGCHLTTGT